ncbi:MAG: ABC transporter permease [Bacillota bacterium]
MFYLTYAAYELKKWTRDSLTAFMLIYPLMFGAIGRYLVPVAEEQLGFGLGPYYHVILAVIALATAKVTGTLAAFSILDDRDDRVFYAVNVAPLSLFAFISVKLLLVYVFSAAGTAFVIWFSNLASLPVAVILPVSMIAALAAPLFALLINCLASNKVEGFAALKSLNALIVFPVVSLFFQDAREFIYAFEPGFWPAKALSLAVIGKDVYQLSYSAYLSIGLMYAVALNLLAYRLFKKKVG